MIPHEPLVDSRGRTHAPLRVDSPRLVSLVPSTTETLFALGVGDCLVGYTRFCVRPAGQIRPERRVGGTRNPKIGRIVELEPDLLFANREENRREDIEALEAAGLRVWVAEPRSVEGAIADLRATAALVGRAGRGDALAARIEAALGRTRREPRPRVEVAYVIWREPWMVAGRDTFVAALLAEAGAVIPFGGRYPEVTLEALSGVERILLASEPFPFDESHRRRLVEAGLAPERLRLVDGELLSWHGVRLIEGLPYARTILEEAR